jgi:hypothetical protein
MHKRRAVGAKLALDAAEPQHRLALGLGDRLPLLHAVDIFARRIDGLWAALGFLPIVLERPPAPVLRLVDLAVRMQSAQRVVADRAQGDDLLARLQRERIVDLDGRHLGIARQIAGAPVVCLGEPVGFVAFRTCHLILLLQKSFECSGGRAARTSRSTTGPADRSEAVPSPRVR